MDNKRKTKLVCRGWVIDKPKQSCLWHSHGWSAWLTRSEAITAYNRHYGSGFYRLMRLSGLVIAKKLWVEVKHERAG